MDEPKHVAERYDLKIYFANCLIEIFVRLYFMRIYYIDIRNFFCKICPENPDVLKMGPNTGALHMKTWVNFVVGHDIKAPKSGALRVKWYQTVSIAEEEQILLERTTAWRY